jgi:hypothetical protein
MISPHVVLLLIVLLTAMTAFLIYRLRPRTFIKALRWMGQWSGVAIIVLGMSVLVCGFLGFANIPPDKTSGLPEVPLPGASFSQNANSTTGANEFSSDRSKDETSTVENQKSESEVRRVSLIGAIYETFQIFAFNVDHDLLENSFLLRLAMLSAVLLASLVAAKGIAILFHSSYEALGLRFKSRHVVVCGLGRIGRQVLADLEAMQSRFQLVVIEPDPENKNIPWAREMGAVVVIGDATRVETLEAARVNYAREVFVVTGSDECNIESVIEIRDIIHRRGRKNIFGKQLPRLRCHVHILSKDLAEIVREKSLLLEKGKIATTARSEEKEVDEEHLDLEVFNALERTARRLLEDIAATVISESPAHSTHEESEKNDSPQVLHYFLFGFGSFGQTLAMKLAELSHFPSCTRSRMTILDTKIKERSASFVPRYPGFGSVVEEKDTWVFDPRADDWGSKDSRPSKSNWLPEGSPGIEYVCNARFAEYRDVADDEMLSQMIKCCEHKSIQPIILICFEDDRENFSRAERLRTKLNALGKSWPIFVWIPRQRELSQLLVEHRYDSYDASGEAKDCQLIPFGQCYGSVSYDEINDSWMDWLARHFHLVWMKPKDKHWTPVIGTLQNAIKSKDGLQDLLSIDWQEMNSIAKKVWESCSEWERASNRSCAVHTVLKAASLGLRITGYSTVPLSSQVVLSVTPDLDRRLRMMEHYRWVSERLLAGWRYDEERSDTRKTRWQIRPWHFLQVPPNEDTGNIKQDGKMESEKLKDEMIVRLLYSLLAIGLLRTRSLRR